MVTDPGRRQTAPAVSSHATEHLKTALSPIERFRRKLAADKALLDNIPFHKLDVVQGHGVEGDIATRINLASLNGVGNARLAVTIWAHWPTVASNDELPDVHLSAQTSPTNYTRYHFTDISSNASFRAEFLPVKDNSDVLQAILKCCFLVRLPSLPFETRFSSAFIDLVREGCHMYKASANRSTSSQSFARISRNMSPVMRSPPPGVKNQGLKNPLDARESRMVNPRNDGLVMPPRAKDPPRDRTPQSGRATSTSSSRARRLNGSFFENGSRSATSPPEARETRPATLPAAPAKWGVMRSAQISSPGVLPSLTPSSWATVRSAPTYTDVSSQAHKIGTAGRPPEPQSTTQPNLDTASSTTDPRIAEKQVASKTAKFEEEFERLLGLYATQDEIADNLRIINKNISEAGEDKKLADLKERESNALASLRLQHQTAETSLHSNHKRELEELTKRHDGQKKALIETGKAEIKKLHEDHASIRAKMQEETRGLQQDQKVKLQEKNAVSIELERKRKGYTEYEKNQIFDELARQLVKKRKITTEIKGEGDEKKA